MVLVGCFFRSTCSLFVLHLVAWFSVGDKFYYRVFFGAHFCLIRSITSFTVISFLFFKLSCHCASVVVINFEFINCVVVMLLSSCGVLKMFL